MRYYITKSNLIILLSTLIFLVTLIENLHPFVEFFLKPRMQIQNNICKNRNWKIVAIFLTARLFECI